MLISESRLRNSEVLVPFRRMSPSLCCTSGWRMTTTLSGTDPGATALPRFVSVLTGRSPRGATLHQLELPAAPGDVHAAGERHLRGAVVGGGRPLAGHRRAVHDPAIARFVPRPAPVEHAAVVPHDEVADPPAMRVDELGPRRGLAQRAQKRPRLRG